MTSDNSINRVQINNSSSITSVQGESSFKLLTSQYDIGLITLKDVTLNPTDDYNTVYFTDQVLTVNEDISENMMYTITTHKPNTTETYQEVATDVLTVDTAVLGAGVYTIQLDSMTVSFTVVDLDAYTAENHPEKIMSLMLEYMSDEKTETDYDHQSAIELFHDSETPQFVKKIIDDQAMLSTFNS